MTFEIELKPEFQIEFDHFTRFNKQKNVNHSLEFRKKKSSIALLLLWHKIVMYVN